MSTIELIIMAILIVVIPVLVGFSVYYYLAYRHEKANKKVMQKRVRDKYMQYQMLRRSSKL